MTELAGEAQSEYSPDSSAQPGRDLLGPRSNAMPLLLRLLHTDAFSGHLLANGVVRRNLMAHRDRGLSPGAVCLHKLSRAPSSCCSASYRANDPDQQTGADEPCNKIANPSA